MVFVERHEEAVAALVAELHELDERINTFDDVIKNLEADFQKFPPLRDCIEYHSPDEYAPGNEPLLQCYTNLASTFASSNGCVGEGWEVCCQDRGRGEQGKGGCQ